MAGTSLAVFARIGRAASAAFTIRCPHCDRPLPGEKEVSLRSRTWERILKRAEHALHVWDSKYGPLNAAQWEYAGDLITFALEKSAARQDVGERYAWFEQELTALLGHERVHAGFQSRGTERNEEFLESLGEVFEGVPVA